MPPRTPDARAEPAQSISDVCALGTLAVPHL